MRSPWNVAADLIDRPDDRWQPEPHQIPPDGNWFTWLLMGGRGAGKTAAAAKFIHDHVYGPPCLPDVPGGHWVGIIAPTLGDGVTSCVNGPSGLRIHDKGVKVRQLPGGTMVHWSNGAEAKIFGAHTPEDVERLRSGGNRCVAWAEELAAWRYMEDCWQHMRYGLRVGPNPQVIASTTPKNRMLIKSLLLKASKGVIDETTGEVEVVVTKATTADNPHLDQRVKQMLYDDYGGTRLGRQELYAEILDDVLGALWMLSDIEDTRLQMVNTPEHFDRIVVAIDPAVSVTGDEHGIIVAGKLDRYLAAEREFSHLPHGFVLEDCTLHGGPSDWAKRAVKAYHEWGANYIVAEINNGGDMVKHTIHTIDPTIMVKTVHATRGKAKRAEPVSNLYQQHRVHHIGVFGHLEDQMTTWDAIEPDESWSPDRMDAMVWAMTDLLVGQTQAVSTQTRDTRLRGRR